MDYFPIEPPYIDEGPGVVSLDEYYRATPFKLPAGRFHRSVHDYQPRRRFPEIPHGIQQIIDNIIDTIHSKKGEDVGVIYKLLYSRHSKDYDLFTVKLIQNYVINYNELHKEIRNELINIFTLPTMISLIYELYRKESVRDVVYLGILQTNIKADLDSLFSDIFNNDEIYIDSFIFRSIKKKVVKVLFPEEKSKVIKLIYE